MRFSHLVSDYLILRQQSSVSSAILSYARELQERDAEIKASPNPYGFRSFVSDLLSLAFVDLKANTFIIPIMHTLNVLLENDVFEGPSVEVGNGLLES